MKVPSLVRVLVIVVVVVTSGCAQVATTVSELNPIRPRPKPHVEVLSAREWEELKAANRRRLAGEGIPRQASAKLAVATTQPLSTTQASATEDTQEILASLKELFWDLPRRILFFYTGNTPGRFARMMEDDKSADLRREGVLKLVSNFEFARADPYTKRYWQMAQGDPDYLVRVAAIRALNRSRDRDAIGVFVKSLDDPNPLIRLEAAKALANVPDESAVPGLLRHLRPEVDVRPEGSPAGARPERLPENGDVRVASADALRNHPTRDVGRALVEALNDRQFEVAWQARQSLVLMTGRDFRYDQDRWREYLAGEKPFG